MYKIHLTFHTKLLRSFIPNDPDRFPAPELPRPGPVFENEDRDGDDYEVESIQDHEKQHEEKENFMCIGKAGRCLTTLG